MDVGRSNSSGPSQAHQRYREAVADLFRRTRARVQSARQDAARIGEELGENRQVESRERSNVERSPQRPNGVPEVHRRGPQGGDRVDISNASMERISEMLEREGDEGERAKVARLKHAFHSGNLNNPERMERAAQRMLDNHPPEFASSESSN